MWVEKYRPKELDEMVGNEGARLRLLQWLKGWKPGDKPLLLLGPPGTGKTTSISLAAKAVGRLLLDFNASDIRTKKALEEKLEPIMRNRGLFGDGYLLFFDEVDGLYGREDYGGSELIARLVEASPHPIAMAANSEEAEVVQQLSKKAEVVRFSSLSSRQVKLYLKRILEEEGIGVEEAVLDQIAVRSRGDMRAAINSLEGLSHLQAPSIKAIATRDEQLSLKEVLERLPSYESREEALRLLNSCNERNPTERLKAFFLALINSDLPLQQMVEALEALSQLSVLLYKSEVKRNYSLRRYFNRLLLERIFPYRGALKYREYDEIPWPLLQQLWNDARVLREVGRRLGARANCSSRKVLVDLMPYLLLLYKLNKDFASRLNRSLMLEEKEGRVLERQGEALLKLVEAEARPT